MQIMKVEVFVIDEINDFDQEILHLFQPDPHMHVAMTAILQYCSSLNF